MENEELMLTEQETQLGKDVASIEERAKAIIIRDDDDFNYAGKFVKDIKAAEKQVEDFFEPMRKSTYDAYKAVTDRKKEMLDPLKSAEVIVKKALANYQMEQEKKRREEEARLRKLAEEESRRKLEEAVKAEEAGDAEAAEYAMAEAEALDNMVVKIEKPVAKVSGISQTKTWVITGIDLKELPDEFAGCLLRPADEKAIMQLIKATKGQISIPGVKYQETFVMSVRAS